MALNSSPGSAADKSGDATRLGLERIWDQGARLQQLKTSQRVWQVVVQAARNMATSPLTTLLTLFSTALSLFLVCLFLLFLEQTQGALSGTRTDLRLTIYLRDGTTNAQQQALAQIVSSDSRVADVVSISPAQALAAFRRDLGDQASLLAGLEEQNPLPASLEVSLKSDFSHPDVFAELAQKFKGQPGVDEIDYSQGMVEQLAELISTWRTLGGAAVLLILTVTSFLIASTIKLALHSHRQEIEIMKLVGATASHIRVPYVLEGMVQGLIGAALSLGFTWGIWLWMAQSLAASQLVSKLLPHFKFLAPGSICLVLLVGAFVGMAGSYLAVRGIGTDD